MAATSGALSERGLAIADVIKKVAADIGTTPSQVALASTALVPEIATESPKVRPTGISSACSVHVVPDRTKTVGPTRAVDPEIATGPPAGSTACSVQVVPDWTQLHPETPQFLRKLLPLSDPDLTSPRGERHVH